MSSRFSLEGQLVMVDRMTAVLQHVNKNVNGFSNSMTRQFDRVNKSSSRTADIIKGVVGADLITRGIGGMVNALEQGVQLASDLAEVQNVVNVTFKQSAGAIDAWSKNATNGFGLSELQAKKFTGVLGAMMKSSGVSTDKLVEMSTSLTGLAGDFASFYNLDIEKAFEKIKAGISGETEPLKSLGINMSVANMQAYALTKGIRKSWSAMTQAEQTALRYQYIMKASADAQGDFAKTADQSYAVQKRLLDVNIAQFMANSMKKLLPYLVEGLKAANRFITNLDVGKVADGIAAFAAGVKALVPHLRRTWAVISFIAPIIPVLVAGFAMLKVAMLGLKALGFVMTLASWVQYLWMMRGAIMSAVTMTKAWTAVQWLLNIALNANPIGAIILAVTILAGAVAMLVMNLDAAKRKFMEITAFLDNPVIAALLSSIPGMDTALRVRQINQQQNEQGGGNTYASPGTTSNTTTNRSQVDVNFNNTPKGTDIKQSGRPAPGATLNLGVN